MSRNSHYRQCRLERPTETGGTEVHVAWIPSPVEVGSTIRFRDSAREPWSEGWRVCSAGREMPAEQVESDAREWKHHREVTDA